MTKKTVRDHINVLFDSLSTSDGKKAALQTEMLSNGLLRMNISTDVFSGASLDEINQRFANSDDTLAQNLHEAIVHERGHAKSMKGKSPSEVQRMHQEPEGVHISGISPYAYSDGAECVAEVEILLERGKFVPEEAMKLYKKYVGKK